MSARFITELDVRLLDEFGGIWMLLDPLIYYSEILGKLVIAEKGFHTDFASGPDLFWVQLAKGQGRKPAVIHDWLYSSQITTRKEADEIFREALLACGYSKFTAGVYYSAVRAFGGGHWKSDNLEQPEFIQQIWDRS